MKTILKTVLASFLLVSSCYASTPPQAVSQHSQESDMGVDPAELDLEEDLGGEEGPIGQTDIPDGAGPGNDSSEVDDLAESD